MLHIWACKIMLPTCDTGQSCRGQSVPRWEKMCKTCWKRFFLSHKIKWKMKEESFTLSLLTNRAGYVPKMIYLQSFLETAALPGNISTIFNMFCIRAMYVASSNRHHTLYCIEEGMQTIVPVCMVELVTLGHHLLLTGNLVLSNCKVPVRAMPVAKLVSFA